MNVFDSNSETSIAVAWKRRDFHEATAMTLRRYGSEVFGFLATVHLDPDDADEAFSLFAERLWKTIETFEWNCSMRTWVYLLARHASTDLKRSAQRQHRHTIVTDRSLSEVAENVRSATISVLGTRKREALGELRAALPESDRALLVLRLDRQMSWEEVARVLGGEGGLDPVEPQREAARLRQRFQGIKQRMRDLARARGLLKK